MLRRFEIKACLGFIQRGKIAIMKFIRIVFAIVISTFVSGAHAGIFKLNVENGILMGADNVLVNGTYYNVRFLDGECVDLFNGCDDADDFVFNRVQGAFEASTTMVDWALVAGVFGEVDSWPGQTNGCPVLFSCLTLTPYMGFAGVGYAAISLNIYDRFGYPIGDATFTPLLGSNDYKMYNFAVWSEAVEVSEPGAAVILLVGIAGLLVSQRRKQA